MDTEHDHNVFCVIPRHVELSELAVELGHFDICEDLEERFGCGCALWNVLEDRVRIAFKSCECVLVALASEELQDHEVSLAYKFPVLHTAKSDSFVVVLWFVKEISTQGPLEIL